MDQFGHSSEDGDGDDSSSSESERLRTLDLERSVVGLESLESVGEKVREEGLGKQVWQTELDMVRNLNEVVLSTLPGFWKVSKGYMEGKYQKVSLPSLPLSFPRVLSLSILRVAPVRAKQKNSTTTTGAAARRSPNQCRVMTLEILNLYISLLSSFFTLSTPGGGGGGSKKEEEEPDGLPSFVPPIANSTTNCHYVLKILNELQDCANELGALELTGEAMTSLKELIQMTKSRFEQVICSGWVRGNVPTLYLFDDVVASS
jgi:exocyst complex component 2